jgi:nucleotide-binding universal stress UspA family protein
MQSILVLVPAEDRAGRAIALAGRLAERCGARVSLLRVLEENLGPAASAELCQERTKLRDLLLEVETEQVRAMAERLRETVPDVEAHVRWGVPWEATLEELTRDRHDLVVKPASGLTRKGRVFFGSTALHLFRRSSRPVWVVGDEGVLPRRILAAVDPTGGESRLRAARRIVDQALAIARLADATVHVVTAWHPIGAEVLEATLDEAEWKAYRAEIEMRAREGLDRLARELEGAVPSERVHLVEGEARDAIPRFADEQDFDLITMGTLSRSGAVGDLLGSTAEMVLRAVHSSVLTVPPIVEDDQGRSGARS